MIGYLAFVRCKFFTLNIYLGSNSSIDAVKAETGGLGGGGAGGSPGGEEEWKNVQVVRFQFHSKYFEV